MTLIIAKAVNENKDIENLSKETVQLMKDIGPHYPFCGYSPRTFDWVNSEELKPYNSCGNGAAMRVSACANGKTLDEVKRMSYEVTRISHDHYEGIKGAEATAVCIFLARQGKTKEEIATYVQEHYYDLNFTIDGIREGFKFNGTCQGTVPQAIKVFLESTSYEDTIRTAVSLGGDSDTLAAIAGSIAGEFFGIPEEMKETVIKSFKPHLKSVYESLKIS